MKFLIFIIFAFSFLAFAENGMVGRSSSLKYDGTIEQPEKFFINVKNTSGGALVAGNIVTPDLTEDDGVSVNTATAAGSTGQCILIEACADDALCKCQTYGIYDSALLTVAEANATAGQPFYVSTTTAGYISPVKSTTQVPAGIFYDSASSSGAVQVFIKLR
jgi:hypothetical protein